MGYPVISESKKIKEDDLLYSLMLIGCWLQCTVVFAFRLFDMLKKLSSASMASSNV